MKLPKFKEFLVSKLVHLVLDRDETSENKKLYAKDSEIHPLNYEISKNIDDKENIYTWDNNNITESMVLTRPFSIEIKLDSYMFDHKGVSFKTLQKLSTSFETEDIYVNGDGETYQLGEFTTDHSSEIIVTVHPKNPEKLLKQYAFWFNNLREESNKKLNSVKNK